ncbi:MAG TPA: PQQ-binding-like beta-propeller repeat protein [Planctomycetota bacterium]|nr:PQQ-binding-like beta-propeller repeat protein [Planctomycetota bacterium]
MRIGTALALLLAAAQEPLPPVPTPPTRPPGPPQSERHATEQLPEDVERLFLVDRTELRGRLVDVQAAGVAVFREGQAGRERRLPLEEATHLLFGSGGPVRPDPQAEQVRLLHGARLSGRVESFDGRRLVLEASFGRLTLAREDIRSLSLSPLRGAPPEVREEPRDILIAEKAGGPEEVKGEVAYGTLRGIDANAVRFVPPSGEERSWERGTVREIFLFRPGAPSEPPPGWFARVLLRNGDRFVGVLEGATPASIRVFCPLFGRAEVPKKLVLTIAFVPQARMTVGHVLVCDQNGVREFDRQGREVWSYTENVQYAWSARKLDNGNVLIANTNHNQVIEVKPSGRQGGEVVWRLDGCMYPYDAVRLENGNTLVAEHAGGRVAEYDARTRAVVWQHAVNSPMSVQRLDHGTTLICANFQLFEVDRDGRVRWQMRVPGVFAWRAQRLENGNTLVVDHRRGQVLEIDRDGKAVWTLGNLSRPVQALRLDDGNTLILEQGQNRVLEADPADPRKTVPRITGLEYPQAMSTY